MFLKLKFLILLLSAPAVCLAATVAPSAPVDNHVNVRASPSIQASVISSLFPGEAAEHLESVADWYRVKLRSGITGYVHKDWTVLSQNDLTIHFMDVGHGDSTLVNCPNGKMILVDAGSSSGFPGGKLRYYLLKQGGLAGKDLDTLILTHPDIDNYNLISRALDKVSVNNVYLAGREENYSNVKFMNWFSMIDQNRKSFLGSNYFDAEDTPNTEISCGGADIHILAASVVSDKSTTNTMSIVLMIRYGDFEAILTGDATTTTENVILGRFSPEWLAADVVKIANHGSLASSTGLQWAKVVKPKVAVVSAGSKNSHGLPHKETIERLAPYTLDKQPDHAMEYASWDSAKNRYVWHSPERYSEAIYSTATTGNLVVKSNGTGFRIYTDAQKK